MILCQNQNKKKLMILSRMLKKELLKRKKQKENDKLDSQYLKMVKKKIQPRKSVKRMVKEYEDNIIQPPFEFRDDYKPTPLPRSKRLTSLLRTQ